MEITKLDVLSMLDSGILEAYCAGTLSGDQFKKVQLIIASNALAANEFKRVQDQIILENIQKSNATDSSQIN